MTSLRTLATAGAFALVAVAGVTGAASAQTAMDHSKMAMSSKTKMVGGAAMYPTKNIVENAVNSKDHTTLVAAVKAAGLVDTLSGPGPFTVFAPTNAAFGKLPAGTVETLVKPESKDTLTKILTYHVVPGTLTAASLTDGKTLTTVQGETLTVKKKMGATYIVDAKGGSSKVTIADVMQSNGVIHVVDTVLMP
ncbi:fasciclin domain-containing protein [soil metagenome]